ncbi:MAG: hypothetical protein JEZ04_09300 [Spirochaetales bacterium]|nr:hypothetical protein [Spirochaetales bacterium]
MRNKIRLVLIICALFVFVSDIFSSETVDRQIGIIYIKNAVAKYLLGEYNDSVDLLDKAEEFYSTSSDFSYLNGLIRLERDNNINTASKYFKEALDSDDWLLLERRKCLSDLALLLFRKKEYEQIISMIDTGSFPDYRENDLMYLYLLSLKYTGNNDVYQNNLRRSIKRYAEDYRFAALYLKVSGQYKREILERIHSFKNSAGALDVFLKAVLTLEDGPGKIRKLEEYFNDNGKEIEAFIEYYRLTGTITEGELKRLFSEGVFENPQLGKKLGEILPTEALRSLYREAVEMYTGNVYYDLNDDGYFEELHLYDNGKPAGISIDSNQDGVLEKMIFFENGIPKELIITEETFMRINFRKYPFVDEVSNALSDKMNVYTFLINSVALDFYHDVGGGERAVIDDARIKDFVSGIDEQRDNVLKIASYTGGDRKDSFTFLEEEWERQDEYSSILRIYNKLKGNFVYLNRFEMRIAGFGDIDYDRLVDIKEAYSNGILISIEADENKNGIYDYKLSLENSESVSLWDFNEDGIYDCKQYIKDGIITTEYSSALDGVFNIIERN